MPDHDAAVDLDRVLDEIRAAVRAKTASGIYSETFDDEVRSQVFDASGEVGAPVTAAIDRVAALATIDPQAIETTSGVPGGRQLHRLVGVAVRRQVDGIAMQFNDFGAALVPALRVLAEPASPDLVHELDTVQTRLAGVERSARRLQALVDDLVTANGEMNERLDQLERGEPIARA